jgi:hypothetical protein
MKDYLLNKIETIGETEPHAYMQGFKHAADLMPRLLAFYADNFRRTDQDFDKVVKMFFEKLNKQN